MAIRKSIKFRLPHSIEKVADYMLKPEKFLSSLPLDIEVKSIQGDSVIAHLDAFGLKGEIILNFTVSRTPNEVSVECHLIGEILHVLGKPVYMPPKSGLSFKAVATRALSGGTEITFEVFIKSGLLKELSLHREAELFLSALPRALVNALEAAPVAAADETAKPTSPPEAERLMVTAAHYVDSTQATRRVPAVPSLSREGVEPAPPTISKEAALERGELTIKDYYSTLLENPVAIYRLLSTSQLLSVVNLDRATSLSKLLAEMSSRAGSPIYVTLRAKEWSARLLVDGGSILGVLVESGTQVVKGKEALDHLSKVTEGVTCAIYRVSKDVLESLRNL